MTDKKLEVKNLRISFRTVNGKVQAVRDISFDLYEGETLAIVGESGSGKSVTTRAIMGISALNAIVESGEIFYEGNDLLKYSEEDFQELRGDKIAMIFQDPMSSLNPIVKVGKQLTEAMLLKNRTRRKNSKKEFNSMLKNLLASVKEGGGDQKAYKELINKFVRAEKIGTAAESRYIAARKNAEEASERIRELLVAFEKKERSVIISKCAGIYRYASKCRNEFLLPAASERFFELLRSLRNPTLQSSETLEALDALLQECLSLPCPDFYALGYFRAFAKMPEPTGGIDHLNAQTREFCQNFDELFREATKQAITLASEASLNKKQNALPRLKSAFETLRGEWDKKAVVPLVREMATLVRNCINVCDIKKESTERTFGPCILSYCERYFSGIKRNAKEERRYARQLKKRDAQLAKNKEIDWKVTPPALVDLNALKANTLSAIERLISLYEKQAVPDMLFDMQEEAENVIACLKTRAEQTASKINKTSARRRAIRLLNEVGIPDAEKRYNQYPFQLSGGQRQRIVIAIALSADPDILICDEPTTALDVTIQAQILELINKVKKERNLSVIFITHDLGVVANIADRIAVMYAGKIVEYGTSEEIFYFPAHPYTWALLSSVPDLESNERLEAIPGTPPNMIFPPSGDAFAERNRYALEIDFKKEPPMFRITDTHFAATWLLHPLAPKVEIPASVTDRIARMKKEAERE